MQFIFCLSRVFRYWLVGKMLMVLVLCHLRSPPNHDPLMSKGCTTNHEFFKISHSFQVFSEILCFFANFRVVSSACHYEWIRKCYIHATHLKDSCSWNEFLPFWRQSFSDDEKSYASKPKLLETSQPRWYTVEYMYIFISAYLQIYCIYVEDVTYICPDTCNCFWPKVKCF